MRGVLHEPGRWLSPAVSLVLGLLGCATESKIEEDPVIVELDTDTTQVDLGHAVFVGQRSSSYGSPEPFPDPDYWIQSAHSMASRFANPVPTLIWIVGVVGGSNNQLCALTFPSPGGEHENITFYHRDRNEPYLSAFDGTGVKVYLQVESGHADMGTLIDLVLGRYSAHPSVIGFGVDVEWHKATDEIWDGVPITDEEAAAWAARVRTYNPGYRIFFKHWDPIKMPPTYREEGAVFLNDSQGVEAMAELVEEFRLWGEVFAPAAVGYQFGYERDFPWWSALGDPPKDLSRAIAEVVPNATDFFWVDFTMHLIWPVP